MKFYYSIMYKIWSLVFFVFLSSFSLFAQKFSGVIINAKSGLPIDYVNVGVIGQNIGTVSDAKGNYSLTIDQQYDNDTLLVSCIGFHSFSIRVGDFKKLSNHSIELQERIFELAGVVVRPKIFKQKILGVSTKRKFVQAGFSENNLGYEIGVLMKVRKSAFIERVIINVARCSYDTLFYRVNIYRRDGKRMFENILEEPIYIELPKDMVAEEVVIDLERYNLGVQGDFLVSLEHVKGLGPGVLYFCASMGRRSYYRKTSQGKWESAPVGISISVEAKVEK